MKYLVPLVKVSLVLAVFSYVKMLPGAPQTTPPSNADVVATGLGLDPDKALKNALMNAVQQAVGLIVDAETIVKNEEIIKDQILTYSDGFVEKFDRLKEGKRDDGLYELRIKAVVRRRQLIEKLKEANISAAKVDGESLFAEVTTQLDAEHSAARLLEKALDGLPVTLLTARVADSKPRIIQKTDTSVKAMWTVLIGFDKNAYETKVLPKLREVLGAIATRKSSVEVVQNAEKSEFVTELQKLPLWRDTWENIVGENPSGSDQDHIVVMLNVGSASRGKARRWSWYILDRTASESALGKTMSRKWAVTVTLKDIEGKTIHRGDIRLYVHKPYQYELRIVPESEPRNLLPNTRADLPWLVCPTRRYHIDAHIDAVEICPYVRAFDVWNGPMNSWTGPAYGDGLECSYETELTLEELRSVRDIQCSVHEIDEAP